MNMRRRRHTTRSAAVLVAVAGLLAACGDDDDDAADDTAAAAPGTAAPQTTATQSDSPPPTQATQTTAATVSVPPGTTLRVGDRQQTLELQFKLSGTEAEGYDVEYANLVGGPATLEAFNAGAIDLAVTGDVPPLTALARGQDVVIVGASRDSGNQLSIVVPPGSDITSVADLKGKTVSYFPGTGAQTFFRRAAAEAGIAESDVTPAQLDYQSTVAALASGDLEAAVLAEPQLGIYLLQNPGAKELRDAAGLAAGLNFVLASRSALEDEAKAAAIADFLTRWERSLDWRNENSESFIQGAYVDAYQLPPDVAKNAYDKLGEVHRVPLDDSVVSDLQAIADDFTEAGIFPEKLDVSTIVDARFDG